MRISLIMLALVAVAGCSSQKISHYSPYDLNRDGVMDARCPGMEYDPSEYRHYSWRADGSEECNEKADSQSEAS